MGWVGSSSHFCHSVGWIGCKIFGLGWIWKSDPCPTRKDWGSNRRSLIQRSTLHRRATRQITSYILRPMSHRQGVARQSRKCDRACRTLRHMARRTVARLVFGIERCSILCDFDARRNLVSKSRDKIAGVTSVLPTTVVRVVQSVRCVCVPVPCTCTITFDRNYLWPRYSARWFTLIQSRSSSYVKTIGQSSRSHEKKNCC